MKGRERELTERSGRRRRPVVIVSALLMLVVLIIGHFILERRQGRLVARHLGTPLSGEPLEPRAPATAESPRRVWIDTDAGCGAGPTVDVDDCFALAVALFSGELEIVGISTTFGNVRLSVADSVTRALVSLASEAGAAAPQVYRGASSPIDPGSPAVVALARALEREPLTVLALGPLTNLAAVVRQEPTRAVRLREVVFVGGKRDGQWMHPGYDHFLTFSDFNVAQDREAVERVLASGAPIALVPFEAALEVTVTPRLLSAMAETSPLGRWLGARSEDWMGLWRREGGRAGFVPFDNAAVLYALDPSLLECVAVDAELKRSPPWFGIGRPWELIVSDDPAGSGDLRYCHKPHPAFPNTLRTRLLAIGQPPQAEADGW